MVSIDKILKKAEEQKRKIQDFAQLIDEIESLDDKRKFLWKEIYQNAVTDRESASVLFNNAYQSLAGSISDHVSLGPIMARYLDKMAKANDQLIKLAEIIRSSAEESDKLSADDIFDKISDDK